MSEELARSLIKRADALFSCSERTNNESYWSELSEFMLNNQFSFYTAGTALSLDSSTPGARRTKRVFDSTALQAVQDLASAIQGTVMNPSVFWSTPRFKNEKLNNDELALEWLESANKIVFNSFNESNLYPEIGKAFQSYVALANMVLLHEEKYDDEGNFDGFRFTSLHMGNVAWAENKDGVVDTLFWKFKLTALAAKDRWGDNCPNSVEEALEDEPDKEFEFLHVIYPRHKKDVKLNDIGRAKGNKRPIASVYISLLDKKIIEEDGYYELPFYAVRWSTSCGEKYGRGCSHLALPDVRTLNRLKERGLEAIDLMVNPPIFVNQRDIFGSLDMRPKSINVVKDIAGIKEFVPSSKIDVLQFSMVDLQKSIKEMFFLDKIQPLASLEKKERMTSLEVAKRLEEMQLVLGSTLTRLYSELLQPLMIRSFKTLLRNGMLPEVPAILRENGIDVEISYNNQLARSQQMQDVTSIQQWIQDIAVLAQVKPEVLDNIDVDAVAKITARVRGVPEEAITNEDVVAAARQQRAQAQQVQAQLTNANMLADTVSKVPTGV